MTETIDHRDRVRNGVVKYILNNSSLIPKEYFYDGHIDQHLVDICTSVMCTKWDIGYRGGGFVEAVVSNDLMGAVSRADGTCSDCLTFIVKLQYNMEYVY
jgi:hypothetical protein